jgi:hypothetical protein
LAPLPVRASWNDTGLIQAKDHAALGYSEVFHEPKNRRLWRILIFVLPLVPQTITDSIPETNAARPTVSTPATLTPVGYLQLENGGLGAVISPEFGTRIGI